MLNNTLLKFGYPESLIHEYEYWYVLLRPQQITLGSLILICKEDVHQYAAISTKAMQEQGQIIIAIEEHLHTAFHFDKINYLMLMMVDPEVHFHVIPRYAEQRSFQGQSYLDHGWPGLPAFQKINAISPVDRLALTQRLRTLFHRDTA